MNVRLVAVSLWLAACGSGVESVDSSLVASQANGVDGRAIKHVFVVAMENQDASTVYGNSNAPYLNSLMSKYAFATRYGDDYLDPDLPSEPHYIQMEAGTNSFFDYDFEKDSDPSADNSTASLDHLTTAMKAVPGVSWMSYQEDMPDACPVKSKFPYYAKHDPFVFFRDVAFGSNGKPDKYNAYCAAHHRDFATDFAYDLSNGAVATYNFISPNICNDMHGDLRCSNGCRIPLPGYGPCIAAGDRWLASNLPPLIAFAEANQGVIFLVWDEAEKTDYAPFLVIGQHLKQTGGVGVQLSHRSLVKSLQRIVGVPVSSNVASANDFSAFFAPGYFP